jgi:hypothetical protein
MALMLLTEPRVSQKKSLGRILHIDFLPISARKVHPDPITSENPHVNDTQPFPKSPNLASHHTKAKVVKMRYHTDDFFAMGDESVLAHNPVSLAL